jgi:hypothetical protein
MPPLLVIPALPRPADPAPGSVPTLPALTELLRLSDASAADSSWRSGLLRDLGAGAGSAAEAVVAAAALAIAPGSRVCLAAPVHAVAGLHRVHLHAAGILALAADERSALADGFTAQFGADLRLHEAGNQWLLEAPCAGTADETDPLEWAGAPLERRPANSPEQRLLRRLGAEIEMWLADHPVNALRRKRGQVPVNLLWMWGGGVVTQRAGLAELPPVRVHGPADDPWLAGCARLAGGPLLPLPASWPGIAPGRDVVVLPGASDAGHLQAWESQWFAPALQDLRAGRFPMLELRVGCRLHRVRQGRIRRLLRRTRPWWQAAGA